MFLYSGVKFESGLLSQIKQNRHSMIQYSVSWKDLKAGCCIDPNNLAVRSGAPPRFRGQCLNRDSRVRIGWPRDQATPAAACLPRSFVCSWPLWSLAIVGERLCVLDLLKSKSSPHFNQIRLCQPFRLPSRNVIFPLISQSSCWTPLSMSFFT